MREPSAALEHCPPGPGEYTAIPGLPPWAFLPQGAADGTLSTSRTLPGWLLLIKLAYWTEQEQSRLCGWLWQSYMESLSAMKVMSGTMSRLRYWVIMGTPLEGAWNVHSHKFGHSDKDPNSTPIWVRLSWESTIDRSWNLHPLWALRTQLRHPTFQLGCTAGHTWSPARHKPPLQPSGLRPTLASLPAVATIGWDLSQILTLLIWSHKLPPSVCNLHVTLRTYWGGLH